MAKYVDLMSSEMLANRLGRFIFKALVRLTGFVLFRVGLLNFACDKRAIKLSKLFGN